MAEKIFCCNIKNIPKNDLGFEVDLIVSGSSPIIIGDDPETIIIDDCMHYNSVQKLRLHYSSYKSELAGSRLK